MTYFSLRLETQYSPYLHFLSENDKVKRFLPLAVIATIKVEVSTNLKKNDNQIRKYLTFINTMCIQMWAPNFILHGKWMIINPVNSKQWCSETVNCIALSDSVDRGQV